MYSQGCYLNGISVSSGLMESEVLEVIARYAGQLLAHVEGFGQGFVCPADKQSCLLCHFRLFLFTVATYITFDSILRSFEKK